MTLIEALRNKFSGQTKGGQGYGTLTMKDATRIAKNVGVTVGEVRQCALVRFGVLVDDPYAMKVTDYTKRSKSPHGQCVSVITGEVLCEANVGEGDTVEYYKAKPILPEASDNEKAPGFHTVA